MVFTDFEVWFGCLSYAIAVNEAIVDQANTFSLASTVCAPRSWVELILVPYQEKKRERASLKATHSGLQAPGSMLRTAQLSTQNTLQPEPSRVDTTKPRDDDVVIHPNFASSLRNTCIANFDSSVERVGVFIEIPEKPEDMVSIDWLVDCNVPIWYAWGRREEAIARKYPIFARYRPPHNAVWAAIRSPQLGFDPAPAISDLRGDPIEEMDSLMFPFSEPEVPSTMKPEIAPYEKRMELRESERNWEQFFAVADSKERLLLQMETLEMKQEREARAQDPPTTRPEAKFYVWERGMRGTFKRRVARDEELEGLFEEKGGLGKSKRGITACTTNGTYAITGGTTVEGELLWWRVYYGLQPKPLTSEFNATAGYPTSIALETQRRLEYEQNPCHCDAWDQSGPQADGEPADGTAHDTSHDTCEMEDGELEEIETDVSWIGVHAYHFLGFTTPPESPHSRTPLPLNDELQTPVHAPRLVGNQGTGQFWASRKGQAIIHFAKCLASNDFPEAYSWDLSRWNTTPLASLPLFKQLRCFRGQVMVQVEAWDNVKGRSTPELIPRMEAAYWLDVASNDSPTTWFIGALSPELALALCRIGSLGRSADPLSIAWYLATRGIPFRTWFKRRPEQIQPLKGIRSSPQLIQFRLESEYSFGESDYQEYVRCRRRLLDGPAGRAAVKMGGIIWRLATEDVGIRDVLSGMPSEEVLCGQRIIRRETGGGFLVDYGLNLDEIMAICGEYEVGIDEGSQKGRLSWWPPPDLWEEFHGCNGWSSFAEAFFKSRTAEIEKNFRPIARSSWRKRLRPSASLKKAREKVRSQSAALFRNIAEGGL
ncbi:hypothetical protein NMY22_g9201 [Coprinellus aureogranulatus]|nr:hypothetical protein NMY22_g9201 [Coprinellus aureogranulatus]